MGNFCSNCGEKTLPGARFCPNCGAAITVPVVETRPASAPPQAIPVPRPAPSPVSAEPAPRGLRWATYCIWWQYPFAALLYFGNGLYYFRSNSALGTGLGFVCLTAAVLFVAAAVELKRARPSGWWLNWFVIGFSLVMMSVSAGMRRPPFNVGPALITFILLLVLYLWPSFVYWTKRRDLFSNEPVHSLPNQWSMLFALPLLWVAFVVWALMYIGHQSTPASETALPPLPAGVTADDVAATLPHSIAEINEGELAVAPHGYPKEIQDLLQSHAQGWEAAKPYLDRHSPQHNVFSVLEVVNRRDELINQGYDPVLALDAAARESNPPAFGN